MADTVMVDKFVESLSKLLVDYAASYGGKERYEARTRITELLDLAYIVDLRDFVEAEMFVASQSNALLDTAWRAYHAATVH